MSSVKGMLKWALSPLWYSLLLGEWGCGHYCLQDVGIFYLLLRETTVVVVLCPGLDALPVFSLLRSAITCLRGARWQLSDYWSTLPCNIQDSGASNTCTLNCCFLFFSFTCYILKEKSKKKSSPCREFSYKKTIL